MEIVDSRVRVFSPMSIEVKDGDGYSHPGKPRRVRVPWWPSRRTMAARAIAWHRSSLVGLGCIPLGHFVRLLDSVLISRACGVELVLCRGYVVAENSLLYGSADVGGLCFRTVQPAWLRVLHPAGRAGMCPFRARTFRDRALRRCG